MGRSARPAQLFLVLHMSSKLPTQFKTYLAWRFDATLEGSFRRKKAQFSHHEYPILAPLPTLGRRTPVMERSKRGGPYIYFVCDSSNYVCYVGKTLEASVIHRWVRPGIGGPAQHYWTHSTRSGGCVMAISDGLRRGLSQHYTLRYVPLAEISDDCLAQFGIVRASDPSDAAIRVERALIDTLNPKWNAH